MPLLRFLPPEDERMKKTVLAIADELTHDGLVLRYRVEETDDGLAGEEGTFTICSFWLVSALVEVGELDRGRTLCEKLLSYASPLQLYAEELDPQSGRHLGNFPQAFTHLALINAVIHVIRAEQGVVAQEDFTMPAFSRMRRLAAEQPEQRHHNALARRSDCRSASTTGRRTSTRRPRPRRSRRRRRSARRPRGATGSSS